MKLEPLIIVPPGTPANGHVRLVLCVMRETEKAVQVTRDRYDGPRAWLPKSGIFRHNPNNYSGEERIDVKVWLYNRIREQL